MAELVIIYRYMRFSDVVLGSWSSSRGASRTLFSGLGLARSGLVTRTAYANNLFS